MMITKVGDTVEVLGGLCQLSYDSYKDGVMNFTLTSIPFGMMGSRMYYGVAGEIGGEIISEIQGEISMEQADTRSIKVEKVETGKTYGVKLSLQTIPPALNFDEVSGDYVELVAQIEIESDHEPEPEPEPEPINAFSTYVSLNINPKSFPGATYPLSGSITVTASEDPSDTQAKEISFESADDIKRVLFFNLKPKTEYSYKFSSENTNVDLGTFTTLPQTDPLKFFKHWEKEGEEGVAYDFSTPVVEDFTLNGVWNTVYLVKFVDSDGVTELYEEKSVIEGSEVGLVMPEEPKKEGFVFAGWQSSIDGHIWDNSVDVVESNMTLIAQWKATYGRGKEWSDIDRRWSEPLEWGGDSNPPYSASGD